MPDQTFPKVCKAMGLPVPVAEYAFAKPRRWRFDLCWPEYRVALEIEGGAYTRGRHVRARGFLADCEKYSEAAVRGWLVIRVPPDELLRARTLDWIRRAIELRSSNISTGVAI